MRLSMVMLLAISLVGCSTYYPKYHEPSDNAPPTTLDDAKTKLEKLRTTYKSQVEQLRQEAWKVGDRGIAGGVVATLGAVARSGEALIGGAAVSGTTTLISSRYGLERQAEAYWKATQAVVCIQDKFHVVNVSDLTPISYKGIDNPAVLITTEVSRGIRGIQYKLFDRLINQTMAQPDMAQFEKAMKDALEKKPLIASENKNSSMSESDNFLAARKKAFESALARFSEDVTTCLAAY